MKTKSTATHQSTIDRFNEGLKRELAPIVDLQGIEVVVGVPFNGIDDRLSRVVTLVDNALKAMGLRGSALLVCAGPRPDDGNLQTTLNSAAPEGGTHCIVLADGFDDYRWSVRALMEASSLFNATLLIFPSEMEPIPIKQTARNQARCPPWLPSLLEPVREYEQDLALPVFNQHPLARCVESVLVFPVTAAVFGSRLPRGTPGVFALSHRLVRSCLADTSMWHTDTGFYGFDAWLVFHALASNASICQVPVAIAPRAVDSDNLDLVFRQSAHALFAQVLRHENHIHPRIFRTHAEDSPHQRRWN